MKMSRNHLYRLASWLAFTCLGTALLAQPAARPDRYTGRATILAGLLQPAFLGGANVAATYFTDRWTFEYSHGMRLTYPEVARDAETTSRLYSPYTTGFGVGYRITRQFDTRLEFKVHGYEATLVNGESLTYQTYSVGLGAYYRLHLWRGLLLEPSVRWWPNVGSSLPGESHAFTSADGQPLVHQAHNLGFFANVSLGYVLGKSR